MKKYSELVGIDISKETFDVFSDKTGHGKYQNNKAGFETFLKSLDSDCCCVMEATGSYHQLLARFLYDQGVAVSVMNPIVIKRYVQMKRQHSKTDKSDARLIAAYAKDQEVRLWQPDPAHITECRMLQTTVEVYFKQSTALKNQLHSLRSQGINEGLLVESLVHQIGELKNQIKKLEVEIERLIREHEGELITNLTTIPGIGKKTAMLLITCTNGFKYFENHRQLSAYFGIAPREWSSGSSIRGKSRITKVGTPRVRNHLFLCSFTACENNPQCKALYDRLVAKGKSKKLALIAVANKLIKQVYGIAQSGLQYDPEYRRVSPVLVEN